MKKILSDLLVCVIPLLLCIALIFTGILSIQSNASLQGNARVINYTGIVRGATQRLIKQELNHDPDDELIADLDRILQGLIHGDEEENLICLQQDEYQALLKEMETEWSKIKEEIIRYRNGEDGGHLYDLSEQYFSLTNEAVHMAEVYTEKLVQQSKTLLFVVIGAFIIIVMLSAVFAYQQEKRRRRLLEAEAENRRRSEQLTKRFQQILMPINEMTELMYVADVNTYDLLFVNDAGKKLFQVDDLKDLKCYKAIQGLDAPCDFCTNACLSKEKTYTWEYTNPIINRHFLLKDRLIDWEDKDARMEIAFDITDSVNEKKQLENRINRDHILIECIRELYQNHKTIDAINHVLQLIGETFEAERSYVFYMENDEMSNIAEWCRQGVTPEIDNLQHLSRSEYGWWFQLYDEQLDILVKDVEELKKANLAEYELVASQGINRLILIPLERYGKFGGMIGLDNLAVKEFDNAATFLRTLGYFVMLAIRRNEDEKILYQLSYLDTLTMLYNRNRYIQDIEELSGQESSVGVAYIDLNGLKEINDHMGHNAGDELLKGCAKTIQDSLSMGNFYRVGGDEFVVICLNVEKEVFKEMIRKLRENLHNSNYEAAVGYQWTDTCRHLKAIIKAADQYMYEDKKNFYQHHQSSGRYCISAEDKA